MCWDRRQVEMGLFANYQFADLGNDGWYLSGFSTHKFLYRAPSPLHCPHSFSKHSPRLR